ncbi:hypothetical protein BT69DRAFT_789778 [Atractiella rhizophila]|nr:hypothetical protein BT69DRAFT_789778 [Atractiella rhizophila]
MADPSKEVFPASEQHPDVDAPQRRRTLSKRRRPLSMSVVSSSDHEHTSIGTTAGSTISRGIYFPSGSLTHEPLLADEGQQSEGRVRKDSISGKRKLHKPSPAEKEWKRTISISNGLPHNDEGYQKVPNNRRSILGRSLSMSLPSKDAPTSPLPPIPSTKPKTPSPVLPVETNLAELNSSQSPQSQPNGAPEAITPSDSMKKRPRFKSFRRSLSSFGGRRPSTSPEDTPVTPYVPANHESPASSRPGTGIGVSNVERATGSTASASRSEHETREQYEEPATIEGGEKPKRRLSRLLGSLRKGGDWADGVKRERSKLKKQTTSKLSTEVEVPVGAAA